MIKRSLCIKLLLLAGVLVVIADLIAPRPHLYFIWDNIPAWSALYGFISCVVIIFASKFLGHLGGLMRKTNYYQQNPKSPKGKEIQQPPTPEKQQRGHND